MKIHNHLASGGSLVLCVFAALGCSKPEMRETAQASGNEPHAEIVVGSNIDEEQKSRILAAKDALFKQLSSRLMAVMGSKGPAAAISVCSNEAQSISATVGKEHGVSIGRIG